MTISIHALLAESDSRPKRLKSRRKVFLSTLSLRRATGKSNKLAEQNLVFLSTLSLRRATLLSTRSTHNFAISIHALLAESDRSGHVNKTRSEHFYPRSPCGERLNEVEPGFVNRLFLSTLSLRRATTRESTSIKPIFDFYPRSPCGERPLSGALCGLIIKFLSTLSLRRAT